MEPKLSESAYHIALRAYLMGVKKSRTLPIQPSESFSTVGRKYVRLRNGSSLIATYNLLEKKIVA